MLGKNAANPLRICEYFNEAELRSAPSKSGSDTHALLKIKDHLIVLYHNPNNDRWKYSLDSEFCKEEYDSRDKAMDAAFEALERKIK